MALKYIDDVALKYFWERLKTYFVKAVDGKGLSTNDLTNELKSNYDNAVTKANALTTAGAEANKINAIKVNGVARNPDSSKTVDITVPTKVSELTNDSGYQTATQVSSSIATAVGKITGISFSIVNSLPTTGTNGVIYLIEHSHSDSGDSYDEYVWIASASKYEKLGNTDVDLSGYMKTSDMSAITTAEIDTMIG
jgi:hypothetical protein